MKFLLIRGTQLYKTSKKNIRNFAGLIHYPHLGLLYIGRSLEDEGHQVEIFDLNLEKDPYQELKKQINSIDAVGISVDEANYKELELFAQFIKNNDPSLPIIIGGQFSTFYPRQSLIDFPTADISVCGYGDFVIKEIAKALDGKEKLSEIAGIHYRKNNDIYAGQPPAPIDDLDAIPFPARHLDKKYEVEYGKMGNIYFHKPISTSIITDYGCPFRCRYCLRRGINTYMERSVENVLNEFRELNGKYGSVMICDSTFSVNIKRAHKIMDGLIEMGSQMELMIAGARVDLADRELYLKMKKAGVKFLFMGIESGNQDVLDFYNKKIKLKQVKEAVFLARKMGFYTTGYFMLGAPIETKNHLKRTIRFAYSLRLDAARFFPLSYRYGSDLWMEAVNRGIIRKDERSVIADSSRGIGNFPKEELEKICNNAIRNFYLRPAYFYQTITKAIATKDFRWIKGGIENARI